MKSPIKWAGGKSWLAGTVKDLYIKTGQKRIVEPFCGSCAVTFIIEPKKALLNDINYPLTNFYQQLKKDYSFDLDVYDLTKEK